MTNTTDTYADCGCGQAGCPACDAEPAAKTEPDPFDDQQISRVRAQNELRRQLPAAKTYTKQVTETVVELIAARDAAESALAEARATIETHDVKWAELKSWVEAVRASRQQTGMHVPYHGPLAASAPSVWKDLERLMKWSGKVGE